MFKAWVCIILLTGGYNSSGDYASVTSSMIGDIARKEDCLRIGEAAVRTSKRIQTSQATFQCVEIMHTPE
jgi:hypothetical protein